MIYYQIVTKRQYKTVSICGEWPSTRLDQNSVGNSGDYIQFCSQEFSPCNADFYYDQ